MLLTIFAYCLGNLFTINDLNMRNRIILCKDEHIDMCKGGGQKRVCISLTGLIFYCRQQFTLIRIMTFEWSQNQYELFSVSIIIISLL